MGTKSGLQFLLVFVLGGFLAVAEPPAPLPSLQVAVSSHYELGKHIGMNFKAEIQAAISGNSFFQKSILPYNATDEGAVTYSNLFEAVRHVLPQYLDELDGMAFGAGLHFSELFLWNVQMEMELLLRKKDTVLTPSCSDLFIVESDSGAAIMGHNEDNDAVYRNTAYLVTATVFSTDAKMPLDNFTAFCYPGELCGSAFGFNSMDLIFTVNALFPVNVNTKQIARNFVSRAVISLMYGEVYIFLTNMRLASGFSINIGDLSTGHLSNIELSSYGTVQTRHLNGTGYHFNMYMNSDVDQITDPSSVHRLHRVQELPPPSNVKDIRDILGDTQDNQYPIFRTATPPDSAATLATGIFDFGKKLLYLYRGNPAMQMPAMTLSMR